MPPWSTPTPPAHHRFSRPNVLDLQREPKGYRDGPQPQSTRCPHRWLERNHRTKIRRGGLAEFRGAGVDVDHGAVAEHGDGHVGADDLAEELALDALGVGDSLPGD